MEIVSFAACLCNRMRYTVLTDCCFILYTNRLHYLL